MKTVWIIGDDFSKQRLVEYTLTRNLDCSITEHANVSSAIQQFSRMLPETLLIDIDRSRQTGLDLIHRMKSNPKMAHIPIGICTMDPKHIRTLQALEFGAAEILDKPYKAENILKVYASLLSLQTPPTVTSEEDEVAEFRMQL